ncbi:HAMP domain-containing sensor histidine kinase [Paenibacillus filicis]|uniref:histidine kinase n=1 Tax=Paenibacillus filicis TaxID=669464 RepID=A0ABU9DCS6_9BACL
MIRLWNLRRKQQLHTSLIFDFFIFHLLFVLLLLLFIVIVLADFTIFNDKSRQVDNQLKLEAWMYTDLQDNRADIQRLTDQGGWLERLDSQGNVVSSMGVKRDSQLHYTDAELYVLLENRANQTYFASMTPLEDKGDIGYLLLKIPRERVMLSIRVNDKVFVDHVAKRLGIYFLLWLGTLLFLIFLYSYWISRRMKKPLLALSQGLKRLMSGDYGARISIEAEKEFGQIRDTFNKMAEVIEETTLEKQKLEESKQRMLIDLSHDLNTPITSIQGYAQALFEGRAGDEAQQKRYLNYVYKKSNQVTRLIRSMLELLTLESPDYHFKLGRHELGEYLREVVAGVYGDIEQRNFSLQVHIPDEDIYAVYDPEPLARVILNLISNALKHNPSGTRLRIELKRSAAHAVIEIADTGTGIPPELRKTVFDPFVTGDESRSGEGSTGLGLSIALKITEKMGGTIRLEETEQEATVFVIKLPQNP